MNNRLEQYVEEIGTRLYGLSDEARAEETQEIQAHLETLAAAEQARGLSEEAAADSAIAQFGAARTVGRQLQNARQRPARQSLFALLAATALAFALTYLSTTGYQAWQQATSRAVPVQGSHVILIAGFTFWLHILNPILIGGLLGFLFRDRVRRLPLVVAAISGMMLLNNAPTFLHDLWSALWLGQPSSAWVWLCMVLLNMILETLVFTFIARGAQQFTANWRRRRSALRRALH